MVRAQHDGEHADAGVAGEGRALHRRQHAAGLGAVREERRSRPGSFPSFPRGASATADLTTCTATPSPSPIAVPPRARAGRCPPAAASRSVVGIDEHVGAGAERDEADLHASSAPSRRRRPSRAGRRRGASASRRTRASSPETSTRSTTVAWLGSHRHRRPRPGEGGRRGREREQKQRERDPAPPGAPAFGRHRGEQIEVRERDRIARPPTVEPEREAEHERARAAARAGRTASRSSRSALRADLHDRVQRRSTVHPRAEPVTTTFFPTITCVAFT